MVVCHCKVVNDRVIRSLVASGETSLSAVKELCGAGSDCGSCLVGVRRVIAEAAGGISVEIARS